MAQHDWAGLGEAGHAAGNVGTPLTCTHTAQSISEKANPRHFFQLSLRIRIPDPRFLNLSISVVNC